MLTGQNGILNRAGEAKEETERSQQEELEKLAGMEALTNINGYEYEDKKTNKKVNIPAGYIVSTKEGENSLEDGLVIKDASGNEFVWVEVPRASVHAAYDGYSVDGSLTNTATIEAGLKEYTKAYKSSEYSGWTDEWYDGNGKTATTGATDLNATYGCGLTYDEYKINKEKMLKSIYENEGFWISRYEIGDEEGTKKNKLRTNSNNPLTTPVSKANQVPYVNVECRQAQELASKMAQGSTVTSSLLFGIQWDLVCKYLEVKLGDNVIVNGKNIINQDSSTWGNNHDSTIELNRGKYTSDNSEWIEYNNETKGFVERDKKSYKKVYNRMIMLTTGASDNTKKQNIYDLAGNLWEWTLEHATKNTYDPRAYRGGTYNYDGAAFPASYRNYSPSSNSYINVGYRVTLY